MLTGLEEDTVYMYGTDVAGGTGTRGPGSVSIKTLVGVRVIETGVTRVVGSGVSPGPSSTHKSLISTDDEGTVTGTLSDP